MSSRFFAISYKSSCSDESYTLPCVDEERESRSSEGRLFSLQSFNENRDALERMDALYVDAIEGLSVAKVCPPSYLGLQTWNVYKLLGLFTDDVLSPKTLVGALVCLKLFGANESSSGSYINSYE